MSTENLEDNGLLNLNTPDLLETELLKEVCAVKCLSEIRRLEVYTALSVEEQDNDAGNDPAEISNNTSRQARLSFGAETQQSTMRPEDFNKEISKIANTADKDTLKEIIQESVLYNDAPESQDINDLIEVRAGIEQNINDFSGLYAKTDKIKGAETSEGERIVNAVVHLYEDTHMNLGQPGLSEREFNAAWTPSQFNGGN